MEVQAHAAAANLPAFPFRNHSEFLPSESPTQFPDYTEQVTGAAAEWKNAGAPMTPPPNLIRCPSTLAAMEVQKVYRSYRTRRMLADSAVVAEELWWQALDFARLNHSTISFFDYSRPETAASRLNRVGLNASKVGKGLSRDINAQQLAFQHWIEAIDPRHRYGHSLHFYYEEWRKTTVGQPFFYWLDIGDGKEFDLKECPRSKLRQQCIKYLGPKEREHYEYAIVDGKILHNLTGKPFSSTESPGSKSKWIFVMSTSKKLYIGEKKKGLFHHSSFLAGGATLAAGRLMAKDGVLKVISAYSGHYRPTFERLDTFLSILKENGINMDAVEIRKSNDDYDTNENGNASTDAATSEVSSTSDSVTCDLPDEEENVPSEKTEPLKPAIKTGYQRTLSGGLQSPKADVPRTAILKRINSKKAMKSYQLGHQLSVKWSTGAGPRIGCIADYPSELRLQALELTHLSPRTCPPGFTPRTDALESPSRLPPQGLGIRP